MLWYVCFTLSLVLMLCGIGIPLLRLCTNTQGKIKSLHVFFGGIFLAATVMFLPIYRLTFAHDGISWLKILLLSLHNTIRLFVIDSDFEIILGIEEMIPQGLFSWYKLLAAFLYVLSPIATFGFVLSFIERAMNYLAVLRHRGSTIYAFSELNERSILLARSIHEQDGRGLFLFTDVYDEEGERLAELRDQAKDLNAICDRRDILLQSAVYAHKKDVYLFLMGDDEQENIGQTLALIRRFHDRKNLHLFVFAPSQESELLLNAVDHGSLIVRRVDTTRSLIQNNLYEQGHRLFDDARTEDEGRGSGENTGSEKTICAYVVGMGRFGTEMVKALSWFCQMDGYRIEIHAFDRDKKASSRFRRSCPELMDPALNHASIPGEAQYDIFLHDQADVNDESFLQAIDGLPLPTYIFVGLGSDAENIRAAIWLRGLFAAKGVSPFIQAVVQSSDERKVLGNARNYRGEEYRIDFIGDNAQIYSRSVIMATALEKEALARHCKWGDEEEFWSYEYNYKSSVASAIHKKIKIYCGIPGAELPPGQRKEKDRENLRVLEHRRWNAYMRAEGYRYGAKRNDIAKVHHCLVPFDELPEKEKKKDDD